MNQLWAPRQVVERDHHLLAATVSGTLWEQHRLNKQINHLTSFFSGHDVLNGKVDAG